MNRDLHLRLNTVDELRQRIEILNNIIISATYHNLKEEPYSSLCCLRNAGLWRNGENPHGGTSYPIDLDPDAESVESTDSAKSTSDSVE